MSQQSKGLETQRRLLVWYAAVSLVPVLLLVYVSVAYLLPAARKGLALVPPTALIFLVVASLMLAGAGAVLIVATARRIGAIITSLAPVLPPPRSGAPDELEQVEAAARRLHTMVQQQKDEIAKLRQEQASLRQQLKAYAEEARKRPSPEEPVPGTWDLEGWQDYLSQEVERARRYHRRFSVLFLQVHRFEESVASLPPHEREEVTRGITERIRSWIRSSDLLAGSPQKYFVMLLPETDAYGGKRVGERIVARLAEGALVTKSALEGIAFSASAGVACFPEDAREPGALVECARAALAAASRRGGGTVALYDKSQRTSEEWPPRPPA